MHGLTVTGDDFQIFWPFAADLALEAGDDSAMARLLAIGGRDRAMRSRRASGCTAGGSKACSPSVADAPAEVEDALFRDVIAELEEWGAMPYGWRTQAALGSWLVAQGRADEAAPLLESARAGFTKIGAIAWLEALESQLAAVG